MPHTDRTELELPKLISAGLGPYHPPSISLACQATVRSTSSSSIKLYFGQKPRCTFEVGQIAATLSGAPYFDPSMLVKGTVRNQMHFVCAL